MVRLSRTLCTEVLIAGIASDSVLTKVLCCLLGQLVVLFILLVVVNSASIFHVHDVGAAALDHVRIASSSDIHSQNFNFLPFLS